MAIFRNVALSFWTDAKVDDDFTPEDKYFYLYLITNPHTNICGCYEISKRAIERETGYTWDTISRLLGRMQNVHNVIRYDEDTKEVLIINWGKYNWGGSSKVKTSVIYYANKVKNSEYKDFILKAVENKDFSAEDVKKKAPKEEKKKPVEESYTDGWPEEEEVRAYVKEKGYGIDARGFWFYNERNYWKDSSGREIKDWKKYLDACEASGSFKKVVG